MNTLMPYTQTMMLPWSFARSWSEGWMRGMSKLAETGAQMATETAQHGTETAERGFAAFDQAADDIRAGTEAAMTDIADETQDQIEHVAETVETAAEQATA